MGDRLLGEMKLNVELSDKEIERTPPAYSSSEQSVKAIKIIVEVANAVRTLEKYNLVADEAIAIKNCKDYPLVIGIAMKII